MVNAGISLKDLVCSCSAGMVCVICSFYIFSDVVLYLHISLQMNELSIVDLNRAEENEANNGIISKLSVALMPQRSSIVLSKMSSRMSIKVSIDLMLYKLYYSC